MLQDNVESYRKEIASLREKEQKMAAAAQKHEQTIHTLNEDLRAAKEKVAMAEVCIHYNNLFKVFNSKFLLFAFKTEPSCLISSCLLGPRWEPA